MGELRRDKTRSDAQVGEERVFMGVTRLKKFEHILEQPPRLVTSRLETAAAGC